MIPDNEMYRSIVEAVPEGIWVVDPEGRTVFSNRRMAEILGVAFDSMPRQSCFACVFEDELAEAQRHFARAMSGDGRAFDFRLRRADGSPVWVSISCMMVYDAAGAPVGLLGLFSDIGERKRAEAEARERQKLETLGAVTSGIAHDFNNLLGSILMDAELAESEISAGLVPAEEIQRIKTVAMRAAGIVRELMVYSGQDHPDLAPLDLSGLVAEMRELLQASVSSQALFETDLAADLPAVWGNAAQIRQVVFNLVVNASEAIGEGTGAIRVATSLAGNGGSPVSTSGLALPQGDYIRLEVSDTGSGMAAVQQARIFDPFFTTKFAGRGLGLAVVQGIVRGHGGAIGVVSTPGRGSRFEVLLPCASRTAQDDREATAG